MFARDLLKTDTDRTQEGLASESEVPTTCRLDFRINR